MHGGEVVGPLHGFDAEVAVLPVGALAVDHDHHGAHGLRALGVGYVVALDAPGRVGQPQCLGQLRQRPDGALPAVEQPLFPLGGLVPGVFHGHLGELELVPPHGAQQVYPAARRLGQQLLQHVLFRRIGGEQDLLGRLVAVGVVLQHELGEYVAGGLAARAFQQEVLRADEPARAHDQQLHHAVQPRVQAGDDVPVSLGGGDGLLLLHDGFHGADAVPVHRRALVVHLPGGLGHAAVQIVQHGGEFSAQEVHHLFDDPGVLLPADLPRAGGGALADLIVDAGAAGLVRLDGEGAGADGEHHARHVQHFPHHRGALIRTEVPRAVPFLAAHQVHGGEWLGWVDADEGIVFAVLQQDIVPGHMQLDEVALQDQRFQFAVHQHDLEVVHLVHHGLHLGCVGLGGVEVLPHAVFQVFRLAHIDDLPLGFHQIAARGVRQRGDLQVELFGHMASVRKSRWPFSGSSRPGVPQWSRLRRPPR